MTDTEKERASIPATFDIETTVGDTATASVIEIDCKNFDASYKTLLANSGLRCRIVDSGTRTNATNATIAAGTGSTLIEALTATKDIVIGNKIGTKSSGTLTISGVVFDGDYITAGSYDWYFSTGATALPAENLNVDISSYGTKAQGSLTLAVQPTAGDWIVIGPQALVFRATADADQEGEIEIGVDLATTQTNVLAALDGSDGLNTVNPLVSAAAFGSDISILTAKHTGTPGNAIPLESSFTSGSNLFDATVMGTTTAGVDVSATDAGDALVAAFDAEVDSEVEGTNAAGTVTVEAQTAGVDGDSLATDAANMTNGAFGAATLAGGADGELFRFMLDLTNATASDPVDLILGPNPHGPVIHADYAATETVTHLAP